MRLIDQIWMQMLRDNSLEEPTHLCLSNGGCEELINDYHEEFGVKEPTLEELQDYLGLKIVVEAAKSWMDGSKYKLLKETSADYGETF